ncbi:alpha/beta hydrolase [Flavobacteriaceae bacterium S356]|uniref:Alpha/beta hydrolase n=1 Tax=Asprobacillus argus TaxID=3076534 RepID=A0ABU3LDP6_9FLAO|nr:alpha/beta hydrolase [Flavobacteriaceae bacterium S356]
MNKKIVTLLLCMLSSVLLAQISEKSELVTINGKKIYYEKHGKGKPLFFLHGYTLSAQAWKPYVKDFYEEYEVYLVDLNGHGKSDAFSKKLSIKEVAKDLNALIQYLQLDKIKAVGFSFGGDILYQLALLNPTLIESMITIGAVGSWDVNNFKKYQEAFTFEKKDNFSWLKKYHKTDKKIKALMEQFKHYTVHVSNEELQSIQPEVLIMVGDNDDGIAIEEVARARKNLKDSDLWILPNVSHGAHEGETKDEFVKKAKAFLSKKKK